MEGIIKTLQTNWTIHFAAAQNAADILVQIIITKSFEYFKPLLELD